MYEFFTNASVSAFVGAFSAFVLVVITDRRRLYRKRTLLRNVVSDNGDHARFKLDAVQRNLELVGNGRVSDAPIMKFPVHAIQQLQIEVIDILNANENQSISALLYWMTAIDDQLERAEAKAGTVKSLELRDPDSTEKQHLYTEYKDILEESVKNLESLIELVGYYVSGRPEKILEFTHG